MLCSKILTFKLPDGNILLVNSLSGAVDLVNPDIAQNLLSGKLSPAEQMPWKKRGYILSTSADEERIQKRIVNTLKMGLSRSYLHAVVMPSYTCNLRCTYCFEGSLAENNINMSLDMVQPLFESILKLSENFSGTSITLYGGEPLLRSNKDIVISILNKAREHNIQLHSVITNGVTLDYWAETLLHLGVRNVQVTIDGIKEVHDARRPFAGGLGSFDKVVKGINMALQSGLSVIARANVDLENATKLPLLAEFYLQQGWNKHTMFLPYLSIVNTPSCRGSDLCTDSDPEVIEKVLNVVNKNWELFTKWKFKFERIEHISSVLSEGKTLTPRAWYCGAGKNMFVFDPQGKIYPCWEHVGSDQEIGNYLPTVEFNESAAQWAERTIEIIPACKQCSMNLLCGGGCPYHAQQQHGSFQSPACYRPKDTLDQIVPFLYTRLHQESIQK